jgi:hypothetical protein
MLVHGNLRDVNIFVRTDGHHEQVVKILDFDWGGHVQDAKYPVNVNHKGIWRPIGVIDNKPVTHEHDKEMLNKSLK